MKRTICALALSLVALGAPGSGHAQPVPDWNPNGLQLTRTDLQDLLSRLEDVSLSSAYSGAMRQEAEDYGRRIRERLSEGDFRVGDRIWLNVEGEDLPDSLLVEPGPKISLPVMGPISLHGVLRSELEDHLTREIGRFIVDPTVRARSMIRLSIQGSVGRPGFYAVPSETLLGEALMVAGGPTSSANMDDLELRRGMLVLWEGEMLQQEITDGRTLDQMSLQAGDQLFVPERTTGFWRNAGVYALATATTIAVTLLARR